MRHDYILGHDRRACSRTGLTSIRLAAAIAMTMIATASAAAEPFFGTRRNDNLTPPSLTGRCAPLPTVNIGPIFSSYYEGTSNFGDFSIRQNQCAAGPNVSPNIIDGRWEYIFTDGSLIGTHFGTLVPRGMTGIDDIVSLFTVTGGTGRYRHASGQFDSAGTRDFFSGRPNVVLAFEGDVEVPEPWIAGLFGLSAAGLAFGRRSAGHTMLARPRGQSRGRRQVAHTRSKTTMNGLFFAAALVAGTVMAAPAQAAIVPPGSSGVDITPFAPMVATLGTQVAFGSATGDAPGFRARVLSAVYRNTLGTLDFHYQTFHLGAGVGGNEEITVGTAGNFGDFVVEAFALALDPDGAGPFQPVNNFTPPLGRTTLASRSANGDVVSYDLYGAGPNGLIEGENTATWIFRTDAIRFADGTFSVFAGGSEFQIVGFAPVPAPAVGALFGLALAGLTIMRRAIAAPAGQMSA